MITFGFENIKAWQYSRQLVKEVYLLLRKFPFDERDALSKQIKRAVVSIPSNIAEGSGRFSRKEQCHFYEIAYGSLMETACQLMLAVDLGYLSEDEISPVKELIQISGRTLSGLRNSVKEQ